MIEGSNFKLLWFIVHLKELISVKFFFFFFFFFFISPNHVQRDTCIKGLFLPPLEPKTECCFSPISSYWFIRRIA